MRLLFAALTALLLVCSSAQAGWRIDRAKQIAAIVWNHPCAEQGIKIVWMDVPGAPNAVAGADLANCRVMITPGTAYPWPIFCSVVLHEVGHLDGYTNPIGMPVPVDALHPDGRDHEHSPDPNSIMFAGATWGKAIIHIGHTTRVVWNADPRCARRGEPFLLRHGSALTALDHSEPRQQR